MIKIKFCGDWINIGRRFKIVNIIFIILNEKDIIMSERGKYVLLMIKRSEIYDNLKLSFVDLINEMESLK